MADYLSPEQVAELEAAAACPYWERVSPTGYCVSKWWAGGPLARFSDGLAVVLGMAVLGLIVAEAARIKPFSPVLRKLKQGRSEIKFLENQSLRGLSVRELRVRLRECEDAIDAAYLGILQAGQSEAPVFSRSRSL